MDSKDPRAMNHCLWQIALEFILFMNSIGVAITPIQRCLYQRRGGPNVGTSVFIRACLALQQPIGKFLPTRIHRFSAIR